MPIEPPWFQVLLSALTRSAPDLVTTADASLAPAIVQDAVTATVPGCDACAVHFPVLRSGGRVDRPFPEAVTAPSLHAVLSAEGEVRAGPVRAVARDNRAGPVYLADVAQDARWPAFGRALSDTTTAVRALAVVPLQVASRGVVMIAADGPHALDAAAAHLDALGGLVELFLRLAWAETRARHARDGLETRQVIGTATGVVMATERVPAQTALDGLRESAQRSGRRLRDVAADVVEGTTARPS